MEKILFKNRITSNDKLIKDQLEKLVAVERSSIIYNENKDGRIENMLDLGNSWEKIHNEIFERVVNRIRESNEIHILKMKDEINYDEISFEKQLVLDFIQEENIQLSRTEFLSLSKILSDYKSTFKPIKRNDNEFYLQRYLYENEMNLKEFFLSESITEDEIRYIGKIRPMLQLFSLCQELDESNTLTYHHFKNSYRLEKISYIRKYESIKEEEIIKILKEIIEDQIKIFVKL